MQVIACDCNAAFASLRQSAEELNKASDALNDEIAAIEAKLKEINIGVSGWVTVMISNTKERRLGYGKHGKQWGLLVQERSLDQSEETEIWRIIDAPRWMRVECLAKLLDLLLHLAAQAQDMVTKMQSRSEQLRTLLSSL